jgi:glycine/D-amino acid oxidase-like deaminating enzyme
VERIERTGDKWQATAPSGSVLADWIVLATDAYATGPWDAIAREQVSLPYFNVATRPLPPDLLQTILPERHGAWDTQTVLTSFRLDRDGRLVFGSVGALRGTATSVHLAFARRALRTLFPQLRDPEFEHAWYGTIGMTSDNVPRFHKFAPNVIGFSGYNGRGIAPGTAFGRILARHVAGLVREDELPLPVTEIQQTQFRNLRNIAYERGAQLAHLFASR